MEDGDGIDLARWSRVLSHLVVGTVSGAVFGGVEWGLFALASGAAGAISWLVHGVNVLYLAAVLFLGVTGLARRKHPIVHGTALAVAAALSVAAWLTLGSA